MYRRRPPRSEKGPCRDEIWLLHLAAGLLIDPLVIAGQTRPFLKERQDASAISWEKN
jgi:hypothetical protein